MTGPTTAAAVWARARAALDGLPDGGLNIAHEAVDRHAAGARAGRAAFRWLDRSGATRTATWAELAATVRRVDGALGDLGVVPGERVVTLLGRTPELYETALGTLRHRSVYCPLFAAYGPEPVRQRLELAEASVLVTTLGRYRSRVAPVRDALPGLRHVLLVDADDAPATAAGPGCRSYAAVVGAAEPAGAIGPTSPDDAALLHVTSGTTGPPKGALHVHGAVVAHHASAVAALDLRPDDVFWCTADPGWVTGTSYGIVAPLVVGATSVVDEAPLDVERWYGILADQRVNVWYTSPTALRMLRRAGAETARRYDLSALRHVATVGEPLDAALAVWAGDALGVPVHDTWWQTETGAIMLAVPPGDEVRPGSMGRPLPGVEAALLRRGPDGRAAVHDGEVAIVDEPDVDGELALRPGWPSEFRGYVGDPERTRRAYAGGWYLTGDVARRDGDGWYWFTSRATDVIKTAGHLVGPYEVERVLLAHPAVVEAAVVGLPDEDAGEIVAAFVVLCPDVTADDDLRLELLGRARARLGPSVAPRSITVVADLPHTSSGKVLRRLVRTRALGLPDGDLSALEGVTS